MTKVIKEEFEKLGLLKINEGLLTYDTQLGMIFNEFNRLSRINDNLLTYEIEVPKPTPYVEQTSDPTNYDLGEYEWKMSYEECEKIYAKAVILINKRLVRLINETVEQWLDLKYRNHKTMDKNIKKVVIDDMEYDPSDVKFDESLALKFYKHKTMDKYTKNALWIYWTRDDDEVELTDEESSDPNDENLIDESKVAKIFRIQTNLFNFKTPTCKAFKEFNYLFQINPDVLTKDIVGFKTYEEYKDDWIYEWNKNVSWVHENHRRMMERGKNQLTLNIIVNHFHLRVDIQNGQLVAEEMMDLVMVGTFLEHIELMKNHEAWRKWEDCENTTHDHEEREHEEEQEDEERCELIDDTNQELPICKIRRFEMIKYSFGQEEEYVAIKEYEYDDLTRTNEDAYHAYKEIFCNMDEGWLVTRAEMKKKSNLKTQLKRKVLPER
ncbi:hypothetical protein Tco_1076514 [Tanacetum coccineum]